jgi:hypothetical protein
MFSFSNFLDKVLDKLSPFPKNPQTNAEKIYVLTQTYDNVCINIHDFTEFLKPEWRFKLDPITNREILSTGLYCTVYGQKLWVSYIVAPGHVRVSNEKILHAVNDTAKWSSPVSLVFYDTIEKVLNLKAFW